MSGVEDKLRDLLAAMEKERAEKSKTEQKQTPGKLTEKEAKAVVCFFSLSLSTSLASRNETHSLM